MALFSVVSKKVKHGLKFITKSKEETYVIVFVSGQWLWPGCQKDREACHKSKATSWSRLGLSGRGFLSPCRCRCSTPSLKLGRTIARKVKKGQNSMKITKQLWLTCSMLLLTNPPSLTKLITLNSTKNNDYYFDILYNGVKLLWKELMMFIIPCHCHQGRVVP